MTSASALADTVALLLFQNIREGMESGRIANVKTAQTEVEAAIAELDRKRLLEGHASVNDLLGKMVLEIRSLHEKIARCESQLAEFQSQAEALKEETTQIVARTEACNLLVEQQQKENAKTFAAMEEMKASVSTAPPPCLAPAPSPADPTLRPAPSRMAVVSFPGGPRTVTIHPPGSPRYQSIIRDEKGDVIISLKGIKPLRREGAFRGPLEDIDWGEIHRVYGRGPELGGLRAVPPVPRWPDPSQPSQARPSVSRGPSDIISRQCQLSSSVQTDAFGRVLAPQYPTSAEPPSPVPSADASSQSASSALKPNVVATPPETPPSPSVGRGKKRTRNAEEDEDEGAPSTTTETREGVPLLLPVGLQTVEEPKTPTPVERAESRLPEGPSRRKKLRCSASAEVLSAESHSRSHGVLDPTRTV